MTTTNCTNQDNIEALTKDSCSELFSAYGVTVSEHCNTSPIETTQFVGVIGFTGDDIRGTLLIAMDNDLLAATLQQDASPSGDTDTAVFRDWIGELSNQLLGRVKNLLLRRGSTITLSIPLVLRGEHLSPLPREGCQRICLDTNSGQVQLWVDTEFARDYVLPAEDIPGSDDVPSEGDAMFF